MLGKIHSGFTLVELMVVITIIAILVLVGAPEFRIWQANTQIRSVAEAFQNDLRAAQAEAVKRNRRVAVVLTNASVSNNSNFVATNPARNWAILSLPLTGSHENSSVFIASHVQSASSNTLITGGVNPVCFNSVGRLSSSAKIASAGNIECANPAVSYDFDISRSDLGTEQDLRPLRIQIRLGGQIRLCDPSRSISDSPDGCETSAAQTQDDSNG